MKKYFTFTADFIEKATAGGYATNILTLDARNATAERLNNASKGFSPDGLCAMEGRVIVARYDKDTGRIYPFEGCFTRGEWEGLSAGSFNAVAVTRFCNYHFITPTAGSVICLNCGAVLTNGERAREHTCGERLCRCGEVLRGEGLARGFCEHCAREKYARIYSYHHRPHGKNGDESPLFEKPDQRANEPHLGFEIECEGGGEFYENNETAHKLADILNAPENAYTPLAEFETDGSINDGIETILRPLTFKGLEKRRDALQRFYEETQSLGGRYGEVNGLHCHIDREYFGACGTDERAKGAILLETLVYKFYDFFALISRRKAGCFGYAYKKTSVKSVVSACLHINEQDHSNAVNGSGRDTVEVRIFGGEIKDADDFLAVADIVQALARWAKHTPLEKAEKATPASICAYIRNAERVRAFVKYPRTDAPSNDFARNCQRDFLAKLDERIQRAKGGEA